MIAEVVYDVPAVVILNSCVRAITAWDLITSMIKAWVFGAVIAIVRTSLVDKLRIDVCLHMACQAASVLGCYAASRLVAGGTNGGRTGCSAHDMTRSAGP